MYRFTSYTEAKSYLESIGLTVEDKFLTCLTGLKSTSNRANLKYNGETVGYIETPSELLPDEEWIVQIPNYCKSLMPDGLLATIYGDTGGNEGWENKQFYIEPTSVARFRFGQNLENVLIAKGPASTIAFKPNNPAFTMHKEINEGIETAVLNIDMNSFAEQLRYALAEFIGNAPTRPDPQFFKLDGAGPGYLISIDDGGHCRWMSPDEYVFKSVKVKNADNANTLGGYNISEIVRKDDFSKLISDVIANNLQRGIQVTWDDVTKKFNFDVADFEIVLTGDVSGRGTVTNLKDVIVNTRITGDTHNHDTRYVKTFGDSIISGILNTTSYVVCGEDDNNNLNGVRFRYDVADVDTEKAKAYLHWNEGKNRNELVLVCDTENNGAVVVDADELTVNNNLKVNGNLIVTGSSLIVTTEDLKVKDNIITLNDGETGAGVSLKRAGLEIDRGTESTVSLVFDETKSQWVYIDKFGHEYDVLTEEQIDTKLSDVFMRKSDTVFDDVLLSQIAPLTDDSAVPRRWVYSHFDDITTSENKYVKKSGSEIIGSIHTTKPFVGLYYGSVHEDNFDHTDSYGFIRNTNDNSGSIELGSTKTIDVLNLKQNASMMKFDAEANIISVFSTLKTNNDQTYWHAGNFNPSSKIDVAGGTFTGPVSISFIPTNDNHIVSKKWVTDNYITATDIANLYVNKHGDAMDGSLNFNVDSAVDSIIFPKNFYARHTFIDNEAKLYFGSDTDDTHSIIIGSNNNHLLKSVDVKTNLFKVDGTLPKFQMKNFEMLLDGMDVNYKVTSGKHKFYVDDAVAFEVTTAGGSDIVEMFDVADCITLLPNDSTLMVIDSRSGNLIESNEIGSSKVVGFVSYNPSIILGSSSDFERIFKETHRVPIAIAGQMFNVIVRSEKDYDAGVCLISGLNGRCAVKNDFKDLDVEDGVIVAKTLEPLKAGINYNVKVVIWK